MRLSVSTTHCPSGVSISEPDAWYTFCAARRRTKGVVDLEFGRSSFSSSRKQSGPAGVFCASAALNGAGTVNANVMQASDDAVAASST